MTYQEQIEEKILLLRDILEKDSPLMERRSDRVRLLNTYSRLIRYRSKAEKVDRLKSLLEDALSEADSLCNSIL